MISDTDRTTKPHNHANCDRKMLAGGLFGQRIATDGENDTANDRHPHPAGQAA